MNKCKITIRLQRKSQEQEADLLHEVKRRSLVAEVHAVKHVQCSNMLCSCSGLAFIR